jgi:hypothetical protein
VGAQDFGLAFLHFFNYKLTFFQSYFLYLIIISLLISHRRIKKFLLLVAKQNLFSVQNFIIKTSALIFIKLFAENALIF